MALSIKKIVLWRKEVENQPGVLAGALASLARAGEIEGELDVGARAHEHRAAADEAGGGAVDVPRHDAPDLGVASDQLPDRRAVLRGQTEVVDHRDARPQRRMVHREDGRRVGLGG